eukprot:scaffold11125_cov84-Isochrysis_galbana.AAC.3
MFSCFGPKSRSCTQGAAYLDYEVCGGWLCVSFSSHCSTSVEPTIVPVTPHSSTHPPPSLCPLLPGRPQLDAATHPHSSTPRPPSGRSGAAPACQRSPISSGWPASSSALPWAPFFPCRRSRH